YADRYNEAHAANQIRITYDDNSNTVFVQAAPGDMAEIRNLIDLIDNTVSSAVSDVRVIILHNAPAADLAQTLSLAISDFFVPTTRTAGGAPTARPPGGFPTAVPGAVPGAGPGALPGAQTTVATLATTARQNKVSSIRFTSTQDKDGKPITSGVLDDVRIVSDPRTNALIVTAPEKTMQLILALL